jgi:hypothetical protein
MAISAASFREMSLPAGVGTLGEKKIPQALLRAGVDRARKIESARPVTDGDVREAEFFDEVSDTAMVLGKDAGDFHRAGFGDGDFAIGKKIRPHPAGSLKREGETSTATELRV